MTTGEQAIYQTVKNNMIVMVSKGSIRVELSTIPSKKIFKEALSSIAAKGFITYEMSFLSAIIVLTPKGKQRLDSGGSF